MIGYYSYAIFALLIYFHSTNAATTFNNDTKQIQGHILEDRTFLRSLSKTLDKNLSFGKRKDIVCDVLTPDEKQGICDRMMRHMIDKLFGADMFLTFVEANNIPFQTPQLVDVNHPYRCKEISIMNINMEKQMFWCRSRQYIRGGPPPNRDNMRGFFLAGSRNTRGRVFAFRPWVMDSQVVDTVAEMDNVGVIKEKDGEPSEANSPTSSSSSSSSSSGPF